MKTTNATHYRFHRSDQRGMTLVEVMVALGIGSVVLAIVAALAGFALRSFAAMGNYQVLDQASALAADLMSKEVREATSVVGFQNTGTTKWMVFANTNASPAYTIRYEWTEADGLLTAKRSDHEESEVLLRGCDRWDFTFYQRTPLPGPSFGFTTNMANQAECKLVEMTWQCSRGLGGTDLLNTETVQTAQIVIRNQRTP